MGKEIDEDLIEATIRRVAEARAAQPAAGETAPAESATDDAPEAVAPSVEQDAGKVKRPASEDLIEATIRRVAAQKAAQDAAPEVPSPPKAKRAVTAAAERTGAGDVAAGDGGPAWQEVAARLERQLSETQAVVLELTARLDSLESRLERATPRGGEPTPLPTNGYRGHLAPVEEEDEWEDTPPARMTVGGVPPRPAIFRDPSPQASVAGQADEVIDSRPLPKPLPPLQVEPKRGLDLLPRTYRITVEDKRRGVDLVPLHRVLLGMAGVRDMSLLSYNNGIAIVSLETVSDLDPDLLQISVSKAMAREARVELHNENTIVIKLAEE